jgi:hypothetical protein
LLCPKRSCPIHFALLAKWVGKQEPGYTDSEPGLLVGQEHTRITSAVQHAHNADCWLLDPIENYIASRWETAKSRSKIGIAASSEEWSASQEID